MVKYLNWNLDNLVDTTRYGQEDRSSILVQRQDLSLLHRAQTGSEAHLASYPMGT
jgi:hypothetical protein